MMHPTPTRMAAVAGVVLMVFALPVAGQGLPDALRLLHKGDYIPAEAALGKLLAGKTRDEALLGLARARLETGRPADALLAAGKVGKGKHLASAQLLSARAERDLGRLPEAEKRLGALLRAQPDLAEARLLLGELLLELGRKAEARPHFDRFYDDFDASKVDRASADQLTRVAVACRRTDNYRDAADTLADALQVDPAHREALLQLAEMSLEKYEAGHAETHYGKALEQNPHLPRALVGLARVKAEQGETAKARELLQRAVRTDPGNLDARVLEAELLLDDERTTEAEELLVKALPRNPRHLPALSVLAASFYLRDDLGGFERMRAKVLALSPGFSGFYRIVVRHAVRHHRYEEAVALGQRAVELDPEDWSSLADLGTGYLRMGDDAEGLKHLRAAWKGDRFNVRTYNLLNLYENVLAQEYAVVDSGHFRLRVHRDEKELLTRTALPLLERAYAAMQKRYGFTPKGPVVVELFRDREHYAVRTVGLPGLGALGVCFGKVITAVSPTAGAFNWGQVLWHELSHVFTIQLSRSRVPRWLTEGLAELEPTLFHFEWKREKALEMSRAVAAGRLVDVAAMNTAFTSARSMQDMELAYFQGALLARHMVERYGLTKVVAGLKLLAQGKPAFQALPAITGMTMEALGQAFAAEQRTLYGRPTGWHLDLERLGDVERFREQVRQRPADPEARAELAAALVLSGEGEEGAKLAAQVLAQRARSQVALFAAARAALARRDAAAAEGLLRRLVKAGGDGVETRLLLGKLAVDRKDLKAAETHLRAVLAFDPDSALPHRLLADGYLAAGKPDFALGHLQALALLEQHDLRAVTQVLEILEKRGDWAAVREWGERAFYIQPASAKLHELLARAHEAAAPKSNRRRAIWHLETALLSKPAKPAQVHRALARLLREERRLKDAAAHEQRAKELDAPGPGKAAKP